MDEKDIDDKDIEYLYGLITRNRKSLGEYDNEEIVRRIISIDGSLLAYAKDQFINDRKFIELALLTDGMVFMHLSQEFKDDKELALLACKQNSSVLIFLSNRLKADREVILCAVAQNAYAICHASESLKNDKEVVITAILNNRQVYTYISFKLQNDIDILIVILVKYRDISIFISPQRFYPYYHDMKIIRDSIIEFLIRSRSIKKNTNIFVKLNTHGIHYGFLFKQHIINYLIPSNLWNIAIRLKDRNGFMWEILDTALIYVR